MLVELDASHEGDHGEGRALIYVVTYETKHDTFTTLHASGEGADEAVLAIAEHNLERWEDYDPDDVAMVRRAIDAKDAEEICDRWTALTADSEHLNVEAKLLDR